MCLGFTLKALPSLVPFICISEHPKTPERWLTLLAGAS